MAVPSEEIEVSILLLSIPSRLDSATALVRNLEAQIGSRRSVEILMLTDNRSQSIAAKRNVLLQAARGRFICFLDDDDHIAGYYIERLLEAVSSHPNVDCISFNQSCRLDGEPLNVEFRIGHPHGQLWRRDDGTLGDIKRPPYHMCLWRRSLAQSEAFLPCYTPDGQSREDIDWLIRLYPKVHSEHHIDLVLHEYIHSKQATASVLPKNEQ